MECNSKLMLNLTAQKELKPKLGITHQIKTQLGGTRR